MVLHKETGLRELALFAGAGGGILGGLLLGWKTVCAVEIEEYPRAVLLQRQLDGIIPRFPIWDDVRTFDGHPWKGKIDIITGGFPCQDISAAGKGRGLEGERSGLWREMARIIGEVRPQYAFVENSPLLVSRGLTTVLGDLAEMGYDARWCVLGADDAGANHERKRIWIAANSYDWEKRIQGGWKKQIQGVSPFSWCKNVRGIEDLRERSGLPEPVLLRKRNGVAYYVDKIKAIGNGQVPAVVALAWETLTSDID